MELLQPATRNPIKLIFRITLHYQYQISNGVAYLKWSYRNLQPELIKVASARAPCSDTETPQVTHFGYLGFIFWCMPFLQLRNCGFGNILRKTQSKPANFWIANTFEHVFYYSATENTSNSMVFCCVAKLCRESRPFLAQFYVANHAVLVTHFNPQKSDG